MSTSAHPLRLLAPLLLLTAAALLVSCRSEPEAVGAARDRLPDNAPHAVHGLVNPYDPDTRRTAIGRVADRDLVRQPGYPQLLRELTADPDPTVRSAAIRALMTRPDPEDAPILLAAAQDPVVYVRWEAATALGRIHDPGTTDPLIQIMIEDQAPEVRAAAAAALGQYHQSTVFDALVAALDDTDFIVARSALESLATLTGENLGPDPAAWARWVSDHRDTLFANARPYRFRPYAPPPRFLDQLTPWEDRDTTPQPPAGSGS